MNNDIALNRKILEWGWYSDSNTMRVFIHLLLNANWHDGEFHGYPLLRGQCIFGYNSFAEDLSISVRNVRTAIKHLKSTKEITQKVTSKFSVITLVNYNVYQSNKNSSDKQVTSKRQASDSIQEGNNYVVSSNEDTCPNKSPDVPKVFEHESIPYRLAIKLSKVIHDERVNPTAKKQDEQQLQKWALTFDRMIRLDKREPKDINNVFEYALFGDIFWRTNMLSAEAVRKHYDRVYPLMIKDRSG